jgi:hypothetical protein
MATILSDHSASMPQGLIDCLEDEGIAGITDVLPVKIVNTITIGLHDDLAGDLPADEITTTGDI